ncbi:hypothetical protein ACFL0T_08615 [Candidatus Omnitrophota bacterium]
MKKRIIIYSVLLIIISLFAFQEIVRGQLRSLEGSGQEESAKDKKRKKRAKDFSIKDIDFVKVSGRMEENVLEVHLYYRNLESGELVVWDGGKMDLKCDVYENLGTAMDVKKGEKLATVYKRLKSSGDGFEVGLPRVAEKKRAIFYCFVDTGYRKLSSRNGFWLE